MQKIKNSFLFFMMILLGAFASGCAHYATFDKRVAQFDRRLFAIGESGTAFANVPKTLTVEGKRMDFATILATVLHDRLEARNIKVGRVQPATGTVWESLKEIDRDNRGHFFIEMGWNDDNTIGGSYVIRRPGTTFLKAEHAKPEKVVLASVYPDDESLYTGIIDTISPIVDRVLDELFNSAYAAGLDNF